MRKLRVGIIGMAPGRSWSAMAIAPALKALPDYDLIAVSTRRMESAVAAANELKIPLAFDNHISLVTHPDVDIVVVSVRVPYHFELVAAALEALKHVYCEWPLANGCDEGRKLADLAEEKNVRAFVGLQLRSAPFLQYIRDLVAEGYVGKVLSTTLISSGLLCGPDLTAEYAYTADVRNGANMLTVTFGHAMDAILYALQTEVHDVNATTATQRKSVRIIETNASIPMTSEDQVAISGRLRNDAIFAAHLWGGPSRDDNAAFDWRIHGTDGDLHVTAPGINIQVNEVTIRGASRSSGTRALPLPEKYKFIPCAEGPAQYVAQAFARVAADIRGGSTTCPTFDDAVKMLRIIAAIREANESGRRQVLAYDQPS